jgi:hypothetical protein
VAHDRNGRVSGLDPLGDGTRLVAAAVVDYDEFVRPAQFR